MKNKERQMFQLNVDILDQMIRRGQAETREEALDIVLGFFETISPFSDRDGNLFLTNKRKDKTVTIHALEHVY